MSWNWRDEASYRFRLYIAREANGASETPVFEGLGVETMTLGTTLSVGQLDLCQVSMQPLGEVVYTT